MTTLALKDLLESVDKFGNEVMQVTFKERRKRMKSVDVDAEMNKLLEDNEILNVFIRLRDK